MRAIGIAIAIFLAVLVTGVGYLWAFNPPTQAPPGGSGAIAVDGANRVGIGTMVPAEELEVAGDIRISGTNKKIDWYAGAIQRATFDDQGTQFVFGSVTNIPINFIQNNGSAIYVDTVKKVGIGTTSPGQLLDVNGATRFRNTMFYGATDEIGLISWGTMGGGTGFGMMARAGRALSLGTNNSWDKLVIDAAGNVGIGTASPSKKLDVYGGAYSADNEYLRTSVVYNSVNHYAGIGVAGGGSNWGINLFADGNKVFTADTNGGVMIGGSYVDSSAPADGAIIQGNVGIGTTSPGAKLDVNGGILGSGNYGSELYSLALRRSGASGSLTTPDVYGKDAGGTLSLGGDSSGGGQVIVAGNVGIGTATPGAKLEVAGQIKITGGIPGASKVLTSDAAGLATWETPVYGFPGKLNGQGRPGVVLSNVAGECARVVGGNTIKISRGLPPNEWGAAAGACPAGWWVCSAAERGAGTCGDISGEWTGYATLDHCRPDYRDGKGEYTRYTRNAWAADVYTSGGISRGTLIDIRGRTQDLGDDRDYRSGPPVTYPPATEFCNIYPTWCCAYQ